MRLRDQMICTVIGLFFVIMLGLWLDDYQTTVAQDTAPAWEYAALAYEDGVGFAFSGDLTANNQLNEAMDALSDDDNLNAIYALNVMGAEGWELLYQQGSPQIVYMFRRPLP